MSWWYVRCRRWRIGSHDGTGVQTGNPHTEFVSVIFLLFDETSSPMVFTENKGYY
ncbi:hypothetical protein ACZ87_03224 [Candidatus Erwinia dacicola]|uniref:Uncharacterized protein n=1 Tax=Candidatus Erwinia dacicola TaxID=252393 RepID=A0A328THR2_9GAMM|nr:hypothetical protein ACZ87_03224 [Candidatus Erwinia dacicola]